MTRKHSAALLAHAAPSPERDGAGPAVHVERFAWGAPDRLEVSGWFTGLDDATTAPAILVVRGADGSHRLPAVSGSTAVTPAGGRHWRAAFAWQEPPTAFSSAELQLGADIVVALPQPGSELTPATGGDGWRLRAELLAAQQEAREAKAAEEQTREELARAREDLASDRARHAAEAERFREGLAALQAAADREIDALRERVARLEREGEENRRLRVDLEAARADAEGLLGRLTTLGRAVDAEG
jgi:hypothetical protein